MKKWLLFSMLICLTLTTQAQIEFKHNVSWAQVKEMARKEHKMIFIDAYTSWCGPCKWMAANVFTDQNVGTFFNENFINYKVDMEKGEGPELAKKFGVNAYPTLIFLDKNGEMVHRFVGSREAEEFIEGARKAMDPAQQFYTLEKRYKAGEREQSFMRAIALAAQDASVDNAPEILNAYLQQVPKSEWTSGENVDLVLMSATSFESESFRFIQENSAEFPEQYLNYAVGQCVESTFRTIVKNNDERKMRELQKKVDEALGAEGAEMKDQIELNFYEMTGNEEKLQAAEKRILASSKDWNLLNEKAWEYCQNETDPTKLKTALEWAKRSVELETNFYNTDTYARLLQKLGNKKEALNWATKARDLGVASGEDVSETEALIRSLK